MNLTSVINPLGVQNQPNDHETHHILLANGFDYNASSLSLTYDGYVLTASGSVAASITIGIVSAPSCALTIALTQMQWAVFRFNISHLYMCFPIGGSERLVVVNSSIRNVLTTWLDSICYMSSRQVSRSQRQWKRLLISCLASSLENPTCSRRQITGPRCPKSVLHVSRR